MTVAERDLFQQAAVGGEGAVDAVGDVFLSYRVDPWTKDVLGYQIDDVLSGAVSCVPSFPAIGGVLGIASHPPIASGLAATDERHRRAAKMFIVSLQTFGSRD